ncbi:MAG: NAD(P)H-hydrate dehydratase [Deltaproteobacteria bacterium]|nr:NAD(P)H-hydrate dehydratase [Deltaproteobacteria bacterium]
MKLVTAAQMRELDRRTIEELGVPSLVLMENAGRTTYQVLRREYPALEGPVAVLAGRGNNGGDGLVVARYLTNDGLGVTVFLLAEKETVRGDARVNLEIALKLGVEVVEVTSENHLNRLYRDLASAGLVVDALLGTGLNAAVHGLYRTVIDMVNGLDVQVLAVDIPSGLCADTGQPLDEAIFADVTVTYGWPKLGQALPPGRDYVGRLWRVDIGIPPAFSREIPAELADPEEMLLLLPPRPRESHKGTFGHLVVAAGSAGKTGAAALTAQGALRAGAGLVTAAVAESLNDILEVKLTEAMTLPLPEIPGERALGLAALEPLARFMEGKTALALGPGLGTHPETQELVRELVRTLPQPLVIDADGVNALAGRLDLLAQAPGPRLITPHPGEMARLTGASTREIQARRLETARELAAATRAVVALKGAQTVVASPEGVVSLNPTGNPILASGGSGDVLTGLIGGFLAQKLNAWDAARLGVYLHGLTADYLAKTVGRQGLAAGDLLAAYPEALAAFVEERFPPIEDEICSQRVIL